MPSSPICMLYMADPMIITPVSRKRNERDDVLCRRKRNRKRKKTMWQKQVLALYQRARYRRGENIKKTTWRQCKGDIFVLVFISARGPEWKNIVRIVVSQYMETEWMSYLEHHDWVSTNGLAQKFVSFKKSVFFEWKLANTDHHA